MQPRSPGLFFYVDTNVCFLRPTFRFQDNTILSSMKNLFGTRIATNLFITIAANNAGLRTLTSTSYIKPVK
jgi:hypothetical protein